MASDEIFENATLQIILSMANEINETTNMTLPTNMTSATIPRFSQFAHKLQLATKYTSTTILVIVMIAMGCTFDINIFIKQIKRPMGIIVCLLCQFGLFPLACFGIAHVSDVNAYTAIGMILLSSCPGGMLSNMLCFWSGANVTLSITLTVVSTVVAMGMTPLNLWIYGRSWDTTEIHMPYIQILLILVSLIVPCGIGILIKKKFPKMARWIAKIGGFMGMLIIGVITALNLVAYPSILQQDAKIYFITGAMPIIAFVIGHICSWIGRLSPGERITVGFEICVQNVGMVFVVSSVTFPAQQYAQTINFVLPFSLWLTIDGFVLMIISRVYLKYVKQRKDNHTLGNDATIKAEQESLDREQEMMIKNQS